MKWNEMNEYQFLFIFSERRSPYILDNTIAIILSVVFTIILTMVVLTSILWYYRRIDIQLYLKDIRGPIEKDGKCTDRNKRTNTYATVWYSKTCNSQMQPQNLLVLKIWKYAFLSTSTDLCHKSNILGLQNGPLNHSNKWLLSFLLLPLPFPDGKKYDGFIAYSDSDSDLHFVLHILVPALQEAGYVPFIKDIDAIPGESKYL